MTVAQPGYFEDKLVLITETFAAASDGSIVHATEEWVVYDYDERTANYWAYEQGKASIVVVLAEAELQGRATILGPASS